MRCTNTYSVLFSDAHSLFHVALQSSHHRYDLISSREREADAWETIYQTDASASSFLRFLRSADRQAGRSRAGSWETHAGYTCRKATNALERIGRSREKRDQSIPSWAPSLVPSGAPFFVRRPWVLTDLDVPRSSTISIVVSPLCVRAGCPTISLSRCSLRSLA